MSTNQEIVQNPEIQKQNDKEYNFAQLRKQAESERNARLDAERRIAELEKAVQSSRAPQLDDDYTDEPYVDQKFLNKKLANFEKTMDQRIEERAEQKARALLEEERRDQYLQRNNDFNQVMSPDNVQRLAETHPELAKSILSMPDGFERQKLVYHQIKTLGLDRPKMKEPSIQEKIDANRRSPYYQPTGSPSAPYSNGGDFSSSGQKNAYNQMQELKNRMRL
jgi:hypothetical protein